METFVNIEYLTWPIIRYKREVLFGWVDLLVSFGGIAGLFLGFSLLSGVEIIYYFTLRACCMLYKNRVSRWHASPTSVNSIEFFPLKSDLYKIEEEKLLETQKHINLSLRPMRQPSQQRSQTNVRQINVIEANAVDASDDGGYFAVNERNRSESIGGDFKAHLPRRMNRAALKLQAARVSWMQ